jgi:hypothetical protein
MAAERLSGGDLGEVIYELVPTGAAVRVTAMHAATLTEVVIQGPAAAGEAALMRVARDKLRWVLARRRAGRATAPAPSGAIGTPSSPR